MKKRKSIISTFACILLFALGIGCWLAYNLYKEVHQRNDILRGDALPKTDDDFEVFNMLCTKKYATLSNEEKAIAEATLRSITAGKKRKDGAPYDSCFIAGVLFGEEYINLYHELEQTRAELFGVEKEIERQKENNEGQADLELLTKQPILKSQTLQLERKKRLL